MKYTGSVKLCNSTLCTQCHLSISVSDYGVLYYGGADIS